MSEHEHTYTEAPASTTIRATSPGGFDVMLTLRGVDGAELMPKVMAALAWLDEQGFTPAPVRSSQSSGNGNAPLCPTHHQAMKQSQHGGWYCPVKIADDGGDGKALYCRAKVK